MHQTLPSVKALGDGRRPVGYLRHGSIGGRRGLIKGPYIDIVFNTNRTVNEKAGPPARWFIYHTKVFLHAIWACGGFAHKVGGCGFATLDLHETLRTDSLVTAARPIDVRRVVL